MTGPITILGATGSVGRSALSVIAAQPEPPAVHALTANSDAVGLAALCREHAARYAVIADVEQAQALRDALAGTSTQVLAGGDALADVAAAGEVHTVLSAIVGAAGLLPTLASIRAGKRVLIANKEPLVMAGALFIREALQSGAVIVPVDSEHNAIFQCLPRDYVCGQRPDGVDRLVLTASGGPFRTWSMEAMRSATPEQAVAHPNWSMGAKISVDSATMMNKGLEVIEASWLFGMPAEEISILVHPESVVHSLVVYSDGSQLAQLGPPDMRVPLAHALGYPSRWTSGAAPLDLLAASPLHFESPDSERFPCMQLARNAASAGGTAPVALNAANEVAVEAFLNGTIGFSDIAAVIETVLDDAEQWRVVSELSLDVIMHADLRARAAARSSVERRVTKT